MESSHTVAQSKLTSDPPLQVVRMSNGITIGYTDEGKQSAPPIIAIHGCPGSHRDWRYVAPLLAPHHRVIRVTMPGFKEVPVTGNYNYDPPSWNAALLGLLNHLQVEKAVMLAHSFGGAMLTNLAVTYPERIAGLIFLCTPGFEPHRGWREMESSTYYLRAKLLQFTFLKSFFIDRARGWYMKTFPKTADEEIYTSMREVHAAPFSLLGANVQYLPPVLKCFISANDDTFIEPEISKDFADRFISGPHMLPQYQGIQNKYVLSMSGGHNLFKSRANEIAELVLQYMDELDGLARSGFVDQARQWWTQANKGKPTTKSSSQVLAKL
eukprot:GILK01009350.1.p1 GENE.GILK01009350.1~~GILK01009350.1.p1  ORF type:complete len:342 (+),score=20.63 GILK01009350.1:54-1028(+)